MCHSLLVISAVAEFGPDSCSGEDICSVALSKLIEVLVVIGDLL